MAGRGLADCADQVAHAALRDVGTPTETGPVLPLVVNQVVTPRRGIHRARRLQAPHGCELPGPHVFPRLPRRKLLPPRTRFPPRSTRQRFLNPRSRRRTNPANLPIARLSAIPPTHARTVAGRSARPPSFR